MGCCRCPRIPSWYQPRTCQGVVCSLVMLVIGLLPLVGRANPCVENWTHYQRSEVHMGTQFIITLYVTENLSAKAGLDGAFARIAKLDAILSNYRSDSELNRFCATAPHAAPMVLGDELWTVLSKSQELSRRSGGAFDVTVGPLTKLWRRARRRKTLPSDALLQLALHRTGYQYLHLDARQQSGWLEFSDMQLDLGAIAKGYAADEALRILKSHGITRACVDAGGDLALGGPPPEKEGWRIGIASSNENGLPKTFLMLANRGVATSGDLWQFIEINGQRYSHILDPHTGLGLTTRTSATVIANDCATADSLASAVVVLGPDRGIALVADYPGAATVVTTPSGEKISVGVSQFR